MQLLLLLMSPKLVTFQHYLQTWVMVHSIKKIESGNSLTMNPRYMCRSDPQIAVLVTLRTASCCTQVDWKIERSGPKGFSLILKNFAN